MRTITYAQAINEAQDICLDHFPEAILMGLGVPDTTGVFGTTTGLQEKYGPERVFDIPLSENAMTGVALGAAITGSRPIFTHHRVEFSLVAIEQIINQAAKWHFMFNGQMSAPLTIRMVIGRGWGQGPQHSQSLQALFAHIPGLKVVMPTTPEDAKGLLISSIADDNPVIFLEHRWLHGVTGTVEDGYRSEPLGTCKLRRSGSDVSVVATSYMTLEALRAADILSKVGVEVDVIDVRTIRPLDTATIVDSVKRTGRLVIADTGHVEFGVSSEISASVVEHAFDSLTSSPIRVGLPEYPTPTGISLAKNYYPTAREIVAACLELTDRAHLMSDLRFEERWNSGQPDTDFSGPF
jgi:pyruvate dehydrogenase E1 component beta subunit